MTMAFIRGLWAKKRQTRGICTICSAIYGSGLRICLTEAITLRPIRLIPPDLQRATCAYFAAVHGTTLRPLFAYPAEGPVIPSSGWRSTDSAAQVMRIFGHGYRNESTIPSVRALPPSPGRASCAPVYGCAYCGGSVCRLGSDGRRPALG